MKLFNILTILTFTVACGDPTETPWQCRTSCADAEPTDAFKAARVIVLAAENSFECDDADVLARAYVELDRLFDNANASTDAIDELDSCLKGFTSL
jgi:hypothetical protein